MIYLDANIFIYALGNMDSKTKSCINILRDVLNGKIEAYTSYLTWDEFSYVIKRQMSMDMVLKESLKFLNFQNLNFIEVDYEIIYGAQKLMETYKLRPRDAIHAASAIKKGITKIASDDSDFDKIKELKRIKLEKFK